MRMDNLVEKTQRVSSFLQTAEMIVGVFCIFLMFGVMIVNVFSRYLLYKPIAWSDELCNYLFVWMSFLASAYVMGNDGHVRVTAIVSRLPAGARSIIHLAMNLIMFVMFLLYVVPSFRMLEKLKLSNMLRIPLKFVYVIMPVCFLLMCAHIANTILKDLNRMLSLRKAASGQSEPIEGPKESICC